MSSPRYSIRPPAGGTPPPMALSRVVLPAPFGPTMVTNSPSPTSRETSASAWSPPYETLRPDSLSMRYSLHSPFGVQLVSNPLAGLPVS